VKVDRASVSLNDAYWNGYSWTVPADAVAGTWHAAFTLNTGVYQGAISTDQPFTVSALPAYTLATTASPTAGGSIGRSPDAASYTSGTVVMLTADVNAGYHFVNWSGDLTGTTNPATITMDGNKTVTAAFEANPFPDLTVDTLAFDPAQPAPGGSVALHFTVRNQGSAPVTADYAMDLYVDGAYVGTSLDTTKLASGSSQAWSWPRTWPSDTASHTFMVVLDPAGIIAESNESNNSASLSASAVPATYTLTTAASPSAGGSIGRSPDAATYASGTVVTLTANPALGYHFVNWSGDLTGSTNPTTVTMTGNKTVTAVFALTTGSYSLSLLPSWNVVSAPFATPVSLLPTCDLFLAWDGSFWQPAATLVPGTGYLVRNTAGTTTVPLTGLPSSSPQTQPATGTWQIIGNPYTTPACFTCTSVVPYLLFWDGTLWQLASPTNLPPGLGFLLQDSSPGTITLTRLP
jgi:uncharacterized repeat protein (TIGR02543 family)